MSSDVMSKPAMTIVLVIVIAALEAYLLLAGQSGWH